MGVLVAVAVGLLAGAWSAVLGARFELAWMGCAALLGVGLLIAVSTRAMPVRPRRGAWPLWALLAALAGQALAPRPVSLQDIPSGVTRIEGTVVRARHGRAPRAVVRVIEGETIDGAGTLCAGARVDLRGLDVPHGARVRVLARVRPNARFFNPTPHPAWPSVGGHDARGEVLGRAQIQRPAPAFARAAHAIRRELRARLEATLSAPAAALARTLLLGESRALDYDDRERVRDAGLSHVLAVSGLHVTLLAGALVWLMRLLLLRSQRIATRLDVGRLAKALGVPCALAYATLVGDAPSAWRAAVTASIAWSLAAAGRRAHPVAVTASAAIVLGALRPDDLGRPGFILSIAATAALVSDVGRSPRSWVRAGLVVGARTMIATSPLVLWLFGDVPLVGLLANLVVVPIAAALLLPLVATHAALATALPPLASLTAPMVDAVGRAFLAVCEVFATIPVGRDLPPPDVAQGVALAIFCVGALAARRWRHRLSIAALAAIAIVGAELHLRHREAPTDALRVTFLDVGQGDAALVDLPDGRLMVIDAGGAASGGPDPGARVLVPLLRARRRHRIDVFVLSHPHPDHYGGLEAVLEAFEIGEIWDSGQAEVETPEGPLSELLRKARRRGTRVRRPPELCDRPRRYGAATARVLWPCPDFDAGWGPNDNSIVVELTIGRRRLLLTGDAEAHAEAELLGAVRPVDVLKVGHHGSRTSSGAAFLAAVRPVVAVVSAGRANSFGHPHDEVWSRLRRRVACPLRTDRDGGVTVWTDGRGLSARAFRGERSCQPIGPKLASSISIAGEQGAPRSSERSMSTAPKTR